MKRPEILSPAGDMQCLKAAILAGCDAIYLGGISFGARAFSANFTNEQIKEAVEYAHGYGVKIYVTINTLIYEREVQRFLEYVEFLYMNNVDAVIVQDIGMMDLIRQTFPDFDVHASTQMHIHNIEGVKLVEKLGLTRAVLARETSIDTIREIKKNTNIELEIFVHGALCISYSGQCLMSSLIGNRSGNRGTCAGTCRQKYNILDSNKKRVNNLMYNLSTKDLNTLEHINELIEIGVDSLKIEGRMKSPSYVYLVTRLYREAVDSYIKTGKVVIDYERLSKLMKTFNRMYTKGFLFNTSNKDIINPFRPNHMGIEIGEVIKKEKSKVTIKLTDSLNINDGIRFINEEDTGLIVTRIEKNRKNVESAVKNDIVTIYTDRETKVGSKVVKTTDYLVNKEIEELLNSTTRKVEISGSIVIKENKKMVLSVSDGINKVTEESDITIDKAINNPTDENEIIKQLNKTGTTIFEFNNIDVELDNNVFVPIKAINELRRKALDELLNKRRIIKRIYKKEKYTRKVENYNPEKIKSVYINSAEQYEQIKDKDYKRIYVDKELEGIKDDRIIVKIPRVINEFKKQEGHILVGELGSVNYYNDVDTDFSLNVVNSYSIALLSGLGVKRITVSYELTDTLLTNMIVAYVNRYKTNPNLAIIVYAKEEMMISKFDVLGYYNLKENGYLEDRFKNLYKIQNKDNLTYIYNYKARSKEDIDKYYDLGISEIRYNIIDKEDLNNI